MAEKIEKVIGNLLREERDWKDDEGTTRHYVGYYILINGIKIEMKSADKTGKQVLDNVK